MRWYLGTENGQWVIRGWPGNKRLPLRKYREFRDDEERLKAFVKRLNAPHDLRTRVSFQHAFINDNLLADYLTYLVGAIPKEETAKQEFSYLKRHCLTYFIHELKLMNPSDWFNASDTKWGAYLLSAKVPKSKKTKRDIINAANRFVRWLHKIRPDEMPLKQFEPLTRNKLDEVERKRVAAGHARKNTLIPESDLGVICKNAPAGIKAVVHLLAHYGLRRNEALGVKPGDVKKGFLYVERQLRRIGEWSPPKGKLPREVPHWQSGAADAYAWVEAVNHHPMHPRTFSAKWDKYIRSLIKKKKIGAEYKIHDLRHTWITRMVRVHPLLDVSTAAGHKDQRITQRYIRDDRGLDATEWKPTG